MPKDAEGDRLLFPVDFDIERWTAGKRDSSGRLIWHHTLPRNRDWDKVQILTLNYDPEGEGDYRNVYTDPQRPLDPFGSDQPGYRGPHKGGRYGPEYYYDIEDLATEFYWYEDTP